MVNKSVSVEQLVSDEQMLPSLGRLKNPPATGASVGLSVSSTEARYAAYKRLSVSRVNLPRGLPTHRVQNIITESTIQLNQPSMTRFGQTDPRYLPWEKLPRYSWRRTEQLRDSDPVLAPDRFYLQTYGGPNYTPTPIQHGLQAPTTLEDVWSEELNASSRRRRLLKIPVNKPKPKISSKKPQPKRRNTSRSSATISAVDATEAPVETDSRQPTPKPVSRLSTTSSVTRCSTAKQQSHFSKEDSFVAESEENHRPAESSSVDYNATRDRLEQGGSQLERQENDKLLEVEESITPQGADHTMNEEHIGAEDQHAFNFINGVAEELVAIPTKSPSNVVEDEERAAENDSDKTKERSCETQTKESVSNDLNKMMVGNSEDENPSHHEPEHQREPSTAAISPAGKEPSISSLVPTKTSEVDVEEYTQTPGVEDTQTAGSDITSTKQPDNNDLDAKRSGTQMPGDDDADTNTAVIADVSVAENQTVESSKPEALDVRQTGLTEEDGQKGPEMTEQTSATHQEDSNIRDESFVAS